MTTINTSQLVSEALVKNDQRTLPVKNMTFAARAYGTLTHIQVGQVVQEAILIKNSVTQVSQLVLEILNKRVASVNVSQIVREVLVANTPKKLLVNTRNLLLKTNPINLSIPFPSGMKPNRDYSFNLPNITTRTEVGAGMHRYGYSASTGKQIHTLNFDVSLGKLKEFNDWYYGKVSKGALSFNLLMDSGMGESYHTVDMIPDTLNIEHYGFSAKITFKVAVKSQILNLTKEEATEYLSDWEADTSLPNFMGGMIYTPRFPVMAPNSSIPRFNAIDWKVDFRLGSVATITSPGGDYSSFTVNAQFRSNLDLVGIIWSSVDRKSHPLFRYDTEKNYAGNVTAFVDNPLDPWNNSLTVTTSDRQQYIYRLFPYYNDSGTLRPYVTDSLTQGSGPTQTYPLSQFYPSGVTVPTGSHIFILDFNNMKQGFAFDGANIPVTSIETLFISMVPAEYGIGSNATLASVAGETSANWVIENCNPNLNLAAGEDIITVAYTQGATFYSVPITVTTWSQTGTTLTLARTAPITGITYTGARCIATKLTLDSPIGDVAVSRKISNIASTGTKAIIGKYDYPQIANGQCIAEGYDDSYDLNPEKIADQVYKLGYRNKVTCYVGASHWYKASSYTSGGIYYNRMTMSDSNPINTPTVAWLEEFFRSIKVRNLGFVWSTSLEILLSQIHPDWAQKDIDDNLSASGYTPPTSFLNFVIPEVLDYLIDCVKQGLGLLTAAGLELFVQMGEFWTWDGSYSNGKPCLYAYATKLAYFNETGNYAPTTINSIYKNPITPEELAYCQWNGDKLGQATLYIRDALKAAYPTVKVCLLFFTPQIFNTDSLILNILNFPTTYWKYPNFDFMQIEDYDYLSARQMDKLDLTLKAALDYLNYPVNVVEYFVGFVNQQQDQYIWANMHIAATNALEKGVETIVVWAGPQIRRDGIVDAFRLPRGLFFNHDPGSVTIEAGDGVVRTKAGEIAQRNALQWKRGIRKINATVNFTSLELKTFLIFIYHQVNLGCITFSIPIDDGSGFKVNSVNILPGTISVSAKGFNFWEVKLTLEGESGYFN